MTNGIRDKRTIRPTRRPVQLPVALWRKLWREARSRPEPTTPAQVAKEILEKHFSK